MIYQVETADALLKEAYDLFEQHRQEISANQDILLSIDEDRYRKLELEGLIKIFTSRTSDGELVGYAVFLVQKNIRYNDSLQALQDVIFIRPDKRGRGGEFISWCDRMLKFMGVQVVYHHVKIDHDWGNLLIRKGYKLVEKVYSRRLD